MGLAARGATILGGHQPPQCRSADRDGHVRAALTKRWSEANENYLAGNQRASDVAGVSRRGSPKCSG